MSGKRNMKAIAAALLVVAGLSMSAQAQPQTLTLACKGTTTITGMEPEPVSMGIIVNFTARTVQGFTSSFFEYPVKITRINDVIVEFRGEQEFFAGSQLHSVSGSIDRVTGDVEVTSVFRAQANSKRKESIISTSYSLKCRPAQRMF
jgi:hypothetical protein